MRYLTGFALVLALGMVPARGQQGAPAPKPSVEIELLEIEQDVDKALFREALMLEGRQGLQPLMPWGGMAEEIQRRLPEEIQRRLPEEMKRRMEEGSLRLRDFIGSKRAAIVERAARLKKLRQEESLTEVDKAPSPVATPAPPQEHPDAIRELENARVEVQLLQAQISLYQGSLDEALTALAEAEVAASRDESLRPQAEEARKKFEETKAKYLDFRERFQAEQNKVNELQSMPGMGSPGGFR
ncbi:hypothetical protein P12x_000939 [Tundrisphaera lichenicola]|uniref:hypothetical protein n=1 Tax=Tundrisphaera lichenicola TaxID=2029860 RepID=UPI003EBE3A2E